MAKSVFHDIADTPGEATNLTARSLLMIAIEQRIHEKRWTQAKAAQMLGVQQPRVSDLMNGKIDKFSLDALVNMLPAVGLTFSVGPAKTALGRGRVQGSPGTISMPGLRTTRPKPQPERRRGAKAPPAAASTRGTPAAKACKK